MDKTDDPLENVRQTYSKKYELLEQVKPEYVHGYPQPTFSKMKYEEKSVNSFIMKTSCRDRCNYYFS